MLVFNLSEYVIDPKTNFSCRILISKLTEYSLIYRYEAKVIKISVEQILLKLRSIHFSDDENLIGMHHRV